MKRKWVILIVLVLLGAVAWIAVDYEPKAYDLVKVHKAIKDFQSDHPEVSAIVENGGSAVYPATTRFRPIRALVRWFKEATGNKGAIGWEEKTKYSDTYIIRHSSGDVVVVVYWTIASVERIGRVGMVSRVEVRPDASSGSQADRVRSELRERFPGLECRIVEP